MKFCIKKIVLYFQGSFVSYLIIQLLFGALLLPLSLSVSVSHCLSLFLSVSLSLTLSLSFCVSLSLSVSLCFSFSLSVPVTLSVSLSLSHFLSSFLCLSLSCPEVTLFGSWDVKIQELPLSLSHYDSYIKTVRFSSRLWYKYKDTALQNLNLLRFMGVPPPQCVCDSNRCVELRRSMWRGSGVTGVPQAPSAFRPTTPRDAQSVTASSAARSACRLRTCGAP